MHNKEFEMQNEPFELNAELLQEYPEMESISGIPQRQAPKDTGVVSQVYVNGNTIDSYIKDKKAGKPTGNIEYHLQMVEKGLKELADMQKPEYQNFIQKETEKLEHRKAEAAKI